MGPLGRALDRAHRHCDRDNGGKGTLMRHFLRLALAPGPLACGVPTRPTATALVALPSAQQRLAPAHRRALCRAVPVASVAVTADAHLLRAAPAAVEPIGLLACLHTPRTQHWTTPRNAGIKAMQTCLHAREHAEGPGFFPGMCPGLRLSGVRTQDSAARPLDVCGPCALLTLVMRPRSPATFDSLRRPQSTRAIELENLCVREQRGEQFRGCCAPIPKITRVHINVYSMQSALTCGNTRLSKRPSCGLAAP